MADSLPVKKSRDGTADLLKGLAVLFMIQVHIMEQFGTTDLYGSFIGKLSLFLGGPPCAPVFLAVMGYFLASSERPFRYFLKRGLMLFAGGIFLNVFRSANLLLQIYFGKIEANPLFYVFGADILTLAGLSLIIIGWLRIVFQYRPLLYFLMAIAMVLVGQFLPAQTSPPELYSYLTAFFINSGEMSYFPLFPWFAYVLTGYSWRLLILKYDFVQKKNEMAQIILLIILWVFIIFTLPWAASISHNLTGIGGYYHHHILFFAWTALFMTAYLGVIRYAETSYGGHLVMRAVKWTGKNVTLIYIIQWLIIGNLATELYHSQNIFQYFFWTVAVTLLTAALSLGYLKIRKLLYKPHPQRSGLHQ